MHDSRIFMCWPNLDHCGELMVTVVGRRATRMDGAKGCGSGAASLARPGCGFGKATPSQSGDVR
ncbi:MAG: hypothetical protein ACFWUL_06900 [Dialister sp.]|jgi:hypothetical protein